MSKSVDMGKASQIIQFIHTFSDEHGFGPTLREIGEAVGLRSTSTVYGYIDRLTKAGKVSSIPGTPRSIHVVEQNLAEDACEDGSSLLCCKFRFPAGSYPMSVIAMVADGDQKSMVPVKADEIEVLKANTRFVR